jgi:hypothetical protein
MPIVEIYLTLPEVEAHIRSLEEKYGVPTIEFLRNASVRERVSEDDNFEWEAYLDHRRELREIDEELRREYIKALSQPSSTPASDRPNINDPLALAA